MTAELKIRDVGGLRNEHFFTFDESCLSFVDGSNSGGKSSVIQAIAAALSISGMEGMDSFYRREASQLGLVTDASRMQESFIHVLADSAALRLEYDDKNIEYDVSRKQGISGSPHANPRFMLAGMISNRSKISRQLRNQDERHEPDDFKWAVTELSHATRYEDVIERLDLRVSELKDLRRDAREKIQKMSELVAEREEIEEKMVALDAEIAELKDQFEGVRDTIEKIEKLRKRKAKRTEIIAKQRAELFQKRKKRERHKKRIDALTKRITELRKKAERIDLKKIEDDVEKTRRVVDREISDLQTDRASVDTLLNLFVIAENHVKKGTTKCPLCKKGELSQREVREQLDDLRDRKKRINDKISSLTLKLQSARRNLETSTSKKESLLSKARTLESEAKHLDMGLKAFGGSSGTAESKLKKDLKTLEELDEEIAKLGDQIGEGNQEAKKLYEEKEEKHRMLAGRLAVLDEKVYSMEIEINERSLLPSDALRVIEGWEEYLDSLLIHSRQRAEEQRSLAAERFNKTVKHLLERLRFEEFRSVMLNSDYRLYVERFDDDKKDYVFQQVRTLSTSEQMTVALILQMALKETYIPDIPFFLIDDIMEDFDEERRKEISSYLREKAKENDLYIICTRLVEGLEEIRVVSQ